MSGTILIVDDDPVQRRLLEAMVHRFGFDSLAAEGGGEALGLLTGPEARRVDLVVLDLRLPDQDGFAVLGGIRAAGLDLPVIVETAHGSIETVVAAMRAGASDFVVKPVGPERLQVSIRNALKSQALEGEIRRLARRQAGTLTFDDLATASPAMAQAVGLGRRAAASSIPVLLEGETGVGKELFARAIAASGLRAGKPFVAVNCGAIPANLVESTLFGHERGAFTGAAERHPGKFAEADGGTLLLDEVGELPPEAQVKLLRVLQEHEVDPVGARRPVAVDVRLVSASNTPLLDLVRAGRLREDLYYRLGVFPIAIPPLRARREDIAGLARRFAARFAAEEGRRVRTIAPTAMERLEAFDWPGNVRQLENAVFRAVVLAEGGELTVADFPLFAGSVAPAQALGPAAPAGADPLGLVGPDGHVRPLAEIEGAALAFALRRYRGRMSEVARRLGIGRSTLYRRMKELAIEPDGRAGVAGPGSRVA
ncbi:MAG TPA: sigma-54 dependent transcriptional regulator [Hyphomicrobiales bacterium]|nr:sigma-54 dependent transcriptional regulator [Hyphomicrobiales bacterium]